jgi:hypothetical protein
MSTAGSSFHPFFHHDRLRRPSRCGRSADQDGTGVARHLLAAVHQHENATEATTADADDPTAESPAGSGTVNVIVTALGGKSATSSADDFTYE